MYMYVCLCRVVLLGVFAFVFICLLCSVAGCVCIRIHLFAVWCYCMFVIEIISHYGTMLHVYAFHIMVLCFMCMRSIPVWVHDCVWIVCSFLLSAYRYWIEVPTTHIHTGETDRHRQTQIDTDRHRLTQIDTDRHRQTQIDTDRSTDRQAQVLLG